MGGAWVAVGVFVFPGPGRHSFSGDFCRVQCVATGDFCTVHWHGMIDRTALFLLTMRVFEWERLGVARGCAGAWAALRCCAPWGPGARKKGRGGVKLFAHTLEMYGLVYYAFK